MAEANTGRNRLPALTVLAAAFMSLHAATADAACSTGNRVDHRDAECLSAWWKNRGLLRKSPYYVRNMCPGYGTVVAKVDLKSANDRTLHLADGLPRDGDTHHRIRSISCCSDAGALCNRSDVVTDEGCLARYNRVSPAAYTCHNEFAVAEISGDAYNCTVTAHCWISYPPPERYPYMPTRITVPWVDLDEVHNCSGHLRHGPCNRARAAALTVSVRDARAGEAEGATLGFTVTLSRAHSETVTVRYATSDGTARAGSDYTQTSGTLTFPAEQTERTIWVPVLDDELDEDPETLTLTLSNPSPSRVQLEDATATGTIVNSDRMPKAWIARFGRTVADHVLDAVDARMRAKPVTGVDARLAGQRIDPRPPFGAGPVGSPVPREARSAETQAGGQGAPHELAGSPHGSDAPAVPDFDARLGSPAYRQAARERALLSDSSFSLTAETEGEGFVSVWGRGTVTRFSGRHGQTGGDLAVAGEVASGLLGADWTRGRWTTGLMVSHSLGDGGYRSASAGRATSTLTAIWPWVRHTPSERLSVWGVAGYGAGSLALQPEGAPAIRTDMHLRMAAAGLRGLVVDGGEDGFALAAKTDAMIVRTSSDAVHGSGGNLAAATADVTRLRFGLDGSRRLRLADGSVLTPGAGVAAHRDGGDADAGFGAEIGAGIAWTDPKRGLETELRGRASLTHRAGAFRERAVSGSFSWDRAGDGRGPRLSATQSLGVPAQGRADTLPGRATLAPFAASDPGTAPGAGGYRAQQQRFEIRCAYGFPAFNGRFTATPEIGIGLSGAGRDYSLAWRLVRASAALDGRSLEIAVNARRRVYMGDRDVSQEHIVGFRVTSRF